MQEADIEDKQVAKDKRREKRLAKKLREREVRTLSHICQCSPHLNITNRPIISNWKTEMNLALSLVAVATNLMKTWKKMNHHHKRQDKRESPNGLRTTVVMKRKVESELNSLRSSSQRALLTKKHWLLDCWGLHRIPFYITCNYIFIIICLHSEKHTQKKSVSIIYSLVVIPVI